MRAVLSALALIVGASVFAAPAYGQTADTLNRRWADATIDDRSFDPWRGHVTLGLGLGVWNNSGVRGGPADAGLTFGSASFGGRVANVEPLGGYLYLGGEIDVFARSDADGVVRIRQRNPSPLDREDYSAEATIELVSHPVHGWNELLAYRIHLGTGAAYQEWNGYRPLWTSSLSGEISYRFDGFSFGPFAGFDGVLSLGEVSSHTARGEIRAGVRYIETESPLFREGRAYVLLGGQVAEANERRTTNLEEDSTLLGGGVRLALRYFALLAEAGVFTNHRFDEQDEFGRHTRSASRYGGSVEVRVGVVFEH